MATEPGQAKKPIFVSATDLQIVVDLNLNCEDRGTDVTSFELSISADGLTYTVITSYDGISPQHTLDKTIDSLTTG